MTNLLQSPRLNFVALVLFGIEGYTESFILRSVINRADSVIMLFSDPQ